MHRSVDVIVQHCIRRQSWDHLLSPNVAEHTPLELIGGGEFEPLAWSVDGTNGVFISCPMMHFFDLYLVQLWQPLLQVRHHLLFTWTSKQTQIFSLLTKYMACLLTIKNRKKMGWFMVHYRNFNLWSVH